MDGNVHFHSRPDVMRRLCLYFFMILAAGVYLLPKYSAGVLDADGPKAGPGTVSAVSQPIGPDNFPTAPAAAGEAARPVAAAERRSDVKVKTGYQAIIRDVGRRHDVEPAMIKAIIMAESSYNPRAVSHRGAAGLMQLMPATAESMGVKDRFDPAHNIDGGVRYFKKMLLRFDGDTRLALAAYNAGARKVRQHNGIPPYKTTRSYIAKVFQYYERYKDLENSTTNKV